MRRIERRRRKKETDFYVFIDYTAQFAKRVRCIFCSQYIESVVSPISVDNNKKTEKERRKTIRATIKPSKERARKRKLMIIVISSTRTFLSSCSHIC